MTTSTTMVKALVELDRLGTPTDDTGRIAVERLLACLVRQPDMDSPNARDWVIDIFARLAQHNVLTPLSGESWEWREVPEEQRAGSFNLQNQRETAVLARGHWGDGGWVIEEAVDVQSLTITRMNEDGSEDYTTSTWMEIVFPYMPQQYVLRVDADDERDTMEIASQAREQFKGQQMMVVSGGRTDGGE